MTKKVEASLPDKHHDFSNWYTDILNKAQLVDARYGVKGFVIYMPLLMNIIKIIYRLFENELDNRGHKSILFPLLIPKENLLKESEHIVGFENEVFWVTEAGGDKLDKPLALRPTSETAMYPAYSLWIKSHTDLPLKLYQSVQVYRHETKATRPLLRSREFLWIESHNVFENKTNSIKQTEEDNEIFTKVVKNTLGIPFFHLLRTDSDKFPGAENTYAFDTMLPDGKMLQIGTTHYLGTKFSKTFNIKYLDAIGNTQLAHQTCYGPGISRIAASILAIHGDEYGLILPFEISPTQIIIIPIPHKDISQDIMEKYTKNIYNSLSKNGFRVNIDHSQKTPGEKFYKYDIEGVPIRIEIGKREIIKKQLTIFRRDKREKTIISETDVIMNINAFKDDILHHMSKRALNWMKTKTKTVVQLNEISDSITQGFMIFNMPFCGKEKCADNIINNTNGFEIRGYYTDTSSQSLNCIICQQSQAKLICVSKSY